MHNSWNTFLNSSLFTNNETITINEADEHRRAQQQGSDFICLLSHYAIIETHGSDAAKFLQGQASCNATDINPQQAQYGTFSTPKGRLFGHFLACQNDSDGFMLRMPSSIAGHCQQQLNKYLAFFKAEQSDRSDDYQLFGLKGQQAKHNIEATFGTLPNQTRGVLSGPGYRVITIDAEQALYECWLSNDKLGKYWPSLNKQLLSAATPLWQLQLIRLGIAEVEESTIDVFVAQMLNYQITDAISFTKGCFTGQEIIARMQYKGKLKRRLYRIEFSSSATIKAGSDIVSPEKNSAVGTIVNVATSGPDIYEALAVLSNEALEHKLTFSSNEGGHSDYIAVLDLPYDTASK